MSLSFAGISFGLLLIAIATCFWRARSRPFPFEPRHTLICAAHPDDCVISGAEYAVGAIESGKTVRIAYLTCGGPNKNSEIAGVRKSESIAAWTSVGLSQHNLTFLGLPESPTGSAPRRQTNEELLEAERALTDLIRDQLAKPATLIIPARGESHVDHRTLRAVAIRAIRASRRDDLQILEVPEYNDFVSLIYSPCRALRALLRALPSGSRLLGPYQGPSHFVEGSSGYSFKDGSRLAAKRHMLHHFPSQNIEELLRQFAYPTRYRDATPYLGSDVNLPRGFAFPQIGTICDATVIAGYGLFLVVGFVAANSIARHLLSFPTDLFSLTLAGAALFTCAAYLIRFLRRRSSLGTASFVWSSAFGLLVGVIAR